MGWLRLAGSLKLWVSFAEYRLFYRALLQNRPIILRSLLIEATPYMSHAYVTFLIRVWHYSFYSFLPKQDSYMWLDSCMCDMMISCVVWLIWDMTYSCVWHDSSLTSDCPGTAPLFWIFFSFFERPQTRLVRKIGSQKTHLLHGMTRWCMALLIHVWHDLFVWH